MPESPDPDWFLKEWMTLRGKRQAALVNELGWHKNQVNRVWHGRQPYRRELVNEVARWLGIRPHELLMRPDEALAVRRLRESVALLAAEHPQPFNHEDQGADR